MEWRINSFIKTFLHFLRFALLEYLNQFFGGVKEFSFFPLFLHSMKTATRDFRKSRIFLFGRLYALAKKNFIPWKSRSLKFRSAVLRKWRKRIIPSFLEKSQPLKFQSTIVRKWRNVLMKEFILHSIETQLLHSGKSRKEKWFFLLKSFFWFTFKKI